MGRNLSTTTTPSVSAPQRYFGTGNIQVFYASGTFTTPVGVNAIRVRVWGAGGSGACGYATSNAKMQGGAGGGYSEKIITSPSSTYTVTVGAGGDRISYKSTGNNYAGNAGGTSSFGSACSATGGAGGARTATYATSIAANAGGTGSSGDANYTGGSGGAITITTGAPSSTNYATGGGSAAGFWGNGFSGGSITGVPQDSNTSFNVTGGGGIGGKGGDLTVASTSALTGVATGGGGSGGAAQSFTMQSNQYNINALDGLKVCAPGPDIYGNIFVNSGNDTTSGINAITNITNIAPRYVGEILNGGGSQGVATVTTAVGAGNAGAGGGGGALYSNTNTANVPTTRAGSGGAFGGGGAIFIQNSTANYFLHSMAGDGGIAAGGGAFLSYATNTGQSGQGGNGIVVVEW